MYLAVITTIFISVAVTFSLSILPKGDIYGIRNTQAVVQGVTDVLDSYMRFISNYEQRDFDIEDVFAAYGQPKNSLDGFSWEYESSSYNTAGLCLTGTIQDERQSQSISALKRILDKTPHYAMELAFAGNPGDDVVFMNPDQHSCSQGYSLYSHNSHSLGVGQRVSIFFKVPAASLKFRNINDQLIASNYLENKSSQRRVPASFAYGSEYHNPAISNHSFKRPVFIGNQSYSSSSFAKSTKGYPGGGFFDDFRHDTLGKDGKLYFPNSDGSTDVFEGPFLEHVVFNPGPYSTTYYLKANGDVFVHGKESGLSACGQTYHPDRYLDCTAIQLPVNNVVAYYESLLGFVMVSADGDAWYHDQGSGSTYTLPSSETVPGGVKKAGVSSSDEFALSHNGILYFKGANAYESFVSKGAAKPQDAWVAVASNVKDFDVASTSLVSYQSIDGRFFYKGNPGKYFGDLASDVTDAWAEIPALKGVEDVWYAFDGTIFLRDGDLYHIGVGSDRDGSFYGNSDVDSTPVKISFSPEGRVRFQ